MSNKRGKHQTSQIDAKPENAPLQDDAAHRRGRPGGQPPSSAEWARAMDREAALAPGAIRPPKVVPAVPGTVLAGPGKSFDLAAVDPDDDGGLDKDDAKAALSAEHVRITAMQEKLYAERRQSLLVVLDRKSVV